MNREPAQPLPTVDVPGDALCMKCGYRLHNLTRPLCPECGTAFEPLNPSTYRVPSLEGEWRRAIIRWLKNELLRPPRIRHLAGAFAFLLLMTVSNWNFDVVAPPPIPTWTVGLAAGLDSLRFLVANVIQMHRKEQTHITRGAKMRYLFAYAICGLIMLTATTPWPLAIRFWLSKASLQRIVEKAGRGEGAPSFQRVGLFEIEYVRSDSLTGGMFLQMGHVVHDGVRYGFVYRPLKSDFDTTHFLGDWWTARR